MQVLNTGTTYRIYDESMRAFTQLPPGVYKIAFNPMAGYSLIKSDNPSKPPAIEKIGVFKL